MNQYIVILLFLLALFLVIFFIYRLNQKQARSVLDGKREFDDGHVWLRNIIPTEAVVVSRKETIHPDAHEIAKVDLELRISSSDGMPIQIGTCWLVEIKSLPELEVGKTVMVKFDPKRPKRVYPTAPWARIWLF